MKKIKSEFIKLIKDPKYYVPLIFVFLLCFGYLLTHATVNIDSLAYDRYFEGTELIKHERFLAPLINKIFNIYSFNPFFHDFLGLLLLVCAGTLFSAMIKSIVGNKIKSIYYTFFTALFISYPLLPEIWTYTPSNISISFGYILTFISAFLTYSFCTDKKKKNIIPAILLLTCALSLYESFAPVFLLSVFIFVFLDMFFNNKKINFKIYLKYFLKTGLIAFFGLIVNMLIAKAIRIGLNLPEGLYVNKNIYYLTYGIIGGIKNLISTMVSSYFFSALIYFPISIILITVFVGLYFTLYQSIDKKNPNIIIIYILILISTVSLSILLGNATPYRACQTFALLVAFTFLIIGSTINNKKMEKVFITFLVLLTFYQCKEMHKWFYINDIRFQSEKNVLIDVAHDLAENYNNKPIVVTGSFALSDSVSKYLYADENKLNYKIYEKICITKTKNRSLCNSPKIGQTNVNSYINWGIRAFNENGTELNKLWKMLGYDFVMGTTKMQNEARQKSLPKYPNKNYIYETEEYIIVNF